MKKLLFVWVIVGCSIENNEQVFYPNGQLKFEVPIKDGLRNGPSKTYFESGKLKLEGYWVNDKLDGVLKTYFESGQVSQIDTFCMGTSCGVTKQFYEDGSIKSIGKYLEDKAVGIHKFFYKNGNLMEVDYYDSLGIAYDYEKYNEEGNLRKDKQGVFVDMKSDTVLLGEEVKMVVHMANNRSSIRVILGSSFDQNKKALEDTIGFFFPFEGKNDSVVITYKPRIIGQYTLYGLVQDREEKGNGMIEVGSIPFSEEVYVEEPPVNPSW